MIIKIYKSNIEFIMKMQIDDFRYTDKTTISFNIKNINSTLVNALRRIVIAEIPTLAFNTEPLEESDASITKNTSALHNEFLLHRIGLIPIHNRNKSSDMFSSYEDIIKFNVDKYLFLIDITNNTDSEIKITTENFRIKDIETDRFLSDEEKKNILPPNIINKYILLNILKPDVSNNADGEVFQLNAKASLNIGKKNSKWSPVCQSSFSNIIDTEKAEKAFLEHIDNEKNKILKEQGREITFSQSEIEAKRVSFNNFDAYRYYITDKLDNPIAFNITIESIGVLHPKEIYNIGIDILSEKLSNFIDNLENPEIINICQSDCLMESFDIKIKDEDDTLGNLIQTYLYNLYILDKDESEKLVTYTGYKIPHPLVNELIIRCAIKSGKLDDLKSILNECKENIMKDLEELKILFNAI